MNNPLISILVAVYNAENELEKCVESIKKQTYKDIEIILVNDGSTDNSYEVCRKLKESDDRIVLINKENEGLFSSRNTGLKYATGDYIGFVDCDDYIEPNMYETMMNDMLSHNADIVMCNHWGIDEKGNKIKGYPRYDSFEIEKKELVKRMFKYEKIFCSSVWSKLYKREIIGDTRFHSDIVLGEDYYFNGRLYPAINKFYYNKTPLYWYRIQEGSMSRSNINPHFFDKYKVATLFEQELKKYEFVTDKMCDNLKFSISYELIYDICERDGKKEIISKWKKIFKNNYKKVKKERNTSLKRRLQIFALSHMPKIYVRIVK